MPPENDFPRFPLTRRRALGALGAIAGAAMLPAVRAQSVPVRMIVNSSSGSSVDATARAVQAALAQALGVPIVIEDQPGAGGLIGAQAVSRASPNGTVLGVVTNNLVIFPSVLASSGLDVARGFTPIAIVGDIPLVLVVNPARMPAANLDEFRAVLRKKGNSLNFGSSGTGGVLHLAGELLLDELGAKARHIPYKGVAPMLTDLLGGQVDFACAALAVVQPHLKTGALRAIGLYTRERVPFAQHIPTLREQGLPNYAVQCWIAVLGPKGMQPAQVTKFHRAVASAFNDPAVRKAVADQAVVVHLSTPQEAQATIERDLDKYAALVKKLRLEPQ